MAVPGREAIQVPFPIAADLTYPYGFDSQDQRHRLVNQRHLGNLEGLPVERVSLLRRRQPSGTNYGGDLRNVGTGGQGRLRPDGTIVR